MFRRVREHVAAHNWFAVGVDFLIVVIGVYLGVQATNWNEDRADRIAAREYKERILDNLVANQADIAARTAYYRQVRGHAARAHAAVRGELDPTPEQFVVDAYQASQVWQRRFERTAFDDLRESGLTRKVGDSDTRAMLSAYYVNVTGFEVTALTIMPYRDRIRSALDLKVQERIRERCDDRMSPLPGGGQAPSLPTSCSLGLPPELLARAANRVRSLPGLEDDLTRLIIDIDQKLALFARTGRNAADLRRELETLR